MIFVDTSFWVAFRSATDSRHSDAVTLFRRYGESSLATTNHVQGETWTFLRRRRGHAAAVQFLDLVAASPRVTVIPVSTVLEETALVWLRKHDERAYSFVDATSYAVMTDLRIREALAFDGDFSAAGFVELRVGL